MEASGPPGTKLGNSAARKREQRTLPDFWRAATLWNPFFYLVDGFRTGFFGRGAVDPWTSLAVVGVTSAAIALLATVLVARGWRIRN